MVKLQKALEISVSKTNEDRKMSIDERSVGKSVIHLGYIVGLFSAFVLVIYIPYDIFCLAPQYPSYFQFAVYHTVGSCVGLVYGLIIPWILARGVINALEKKKRIDLITLGDLINFPLARYWIVILGLLIFSLALGIVPFALSGTSGFFNYLRNPLVEISRYSFTTGLVASPISFFFPLHRWEKVKGKNITLESTQNGFVLTLNNSP